jgi:DNA-binding Lrp family transcriptional regulator
MAVPEPDFASVAEQLAGLPEVAHNYRRDHELNMWFVLAAPSEPALQEAVRRIHARTGLRVYDFPKLAEYHLGFWLHLGPDGNPGLRRWERDLPVEAPRCDALDRALVAATQAGLPLVAEPYGEIGDRLRCDPGTVLDRLAQLLAGGAIRRIGAVPNHYRLGLRGNGMTVWDIEDAEVDGLGAEVGALECVSHCYRRPRRLPLWPYNLFAMVHGQDRTQVLDATRRIESLVGPHCRDHRVLFSEAVLKKTGLRFAI